MLLGLNQALRSSELRVSIGHARARITRCAFEVGAGSGLSRCGIPTLLATMEPAPFLDRFVAGYASIYVDVAAKFDLPTCTFFPSGVLGHLAMVLADRLHPNARAVALCAAGVAPHVRAVLDRVAVRVA